MKYRITGADAITGDVREMTVEAESEQAAADFARSQGVFTYKSEVCIDDSPEAVRQRQADKLVTRIAFGAAVAIVLLIAMCLNIWNWMASRPPTTSPGSLPATSGSYSNPCFSSDDERLEWRSKQNLPMTNEDVKYEQRKLLEYQEKVRASEHPVR